MNVKVKGYEAVEEDLTRESTTEVFVAMWFDEQLVPVWNAIEDAVARTGHEAIRIDRQHFGRLIDDEIVAAIRRAKFVVADFTHGEDGDRGSVYYEVGFARGLGKEVIQTARSDILDEGKIAFDLNHYPTLRWNPEQLEVFGTALEYRIQGHIGMAARRLRV